MKKSDIGKNNTVSVFDGIDKRYDTGDSGQNL